MSDCDNSSAVPVGVTLGKMRRVFITENRRLMEESIDLWREGIPRYTELAQKGHNLDDQIKMWKDLLKVFDSYQIQFEAELHAIRKSFVAGISRLEHFRMTEEQLERSISGDRCLASWEKAVAIADKLRGHRPVRIKGKETILKKIREDFGGCAFTISEQLLYWDRDREAFVVGTAVGSETTLIRVVYDILLHGWKK